MGMRHNRCMQIYCYNDLSKPNFIINISYGFVQYVQQ